MSLEAFVDRFGGVFERSPWIAEAAYRAGLDRDDDTAEGLHRRMAEVVRKAERQRQLELIRAHPDLAGRLQVAGELTPESTVEQRSAGLDHCTPEEYRQFHALNESYKQRFDFPFIMAVRGHTRAEILAAFERRIENDPQTEFETALEQIEQIALLRLQDLLPAGGHG